MPSDTDITGVAAILMHNGKFLLQHRDNKPEITNPDKWGFVGGGIDEGETPEEAVRRECMEEVGVIPQGLIRLGRIKTSVRFYAHLTDEEAQNLVLGEGQAINFFTIEEAAALNGTQRVVELFNTHSEAVGRLVAGETVDPVDLGIEE